MSITPDRLSRRAVLKHAGETTCLCVAGSIMPIESLAAAERLPLTMPLSQFDYSDVKLGEGPLLTQYTHNQSLFLGLDNDALLKPFRDRAGMDAPGADMGGWYDNFAGFHNEPGEAEHDMHGFIPGHSFGQYVSGLARGYATTGDPATKTKIRTLIAGYAQTISPKFFDDYNLPAYIYDKLLVGLMDSWHYAGVREAKPVLARLTRTALPYLPEKALNREEMSARPHKRAAQTWDESYTLPENLFLAYQRGMGEQYKALAQRFIEDDTFFQPLSEGRSPFKGKHAYSHVNGLSSAMQAYLTLGETKYLDAAVNGFRFIEAQSFATGGWGPSEFLAGPEDTERLRSSLTSRHKGFETPCGAYGHFKITRYLLRTTRDSRYGDSMERVLYNTILGAKPTQSDGATFYYSDYNQAARKVYYDDKWPCCSGTFIQLTADYGVSAYLFDADSLYVNLFVPSTVKASLGSQQVTITQTTSYPAAGTTRIAMAMKKAARFSVKLRIPAWAGTKTAVLVNGSPAGIALTPGAFAGIDRLWQPGDTIYLSLDMGLRLEPLNAAHPELVALLTGPLVLFPVNDTSTGLTRDAWLTAKAETPENWVVKAGDKEVRLKPFTAISDETYRLYSQVLA